MPDAVRALEQVEEGGTAVRPAGRDGEAHRALGEGRKGPRHRAGRQQHSGRGRHATPWEAGRGGPRPAPHRCHAPQATTCFSLW